MAQTETAASVAAARRHSQRPSGNIGTNGTFKWTRNIPYPVQRLFLGVLTIFFVIMVTFALTSIIGNPVAQLLPQTATPEEHRHLEHLLGYDRPIAIQFLEYIKNAATGDLGVSTTYNRDASTVLIERLPATLTLVIPAVLVTAVVGVPLGMYAGYRAGSTFDKVLLVLATFGQAIPTFLLGVVLILVFAVTLGWLPASSAELTGLGLVLPVATLSAWSTSAMLRLARSNMIGALSQPYVTLARAKGVSEWKIFWHHAGRNTLLPVFSFGALQFGFLLTGSVVTETVFGIGGIGQLALNGISSRDQPVVQAVVVYGAIMIVLINLITDLCYVFIDPRMRRRDAAA